MIKKWLRKKPVILLFINIYHYYKGKWHVRKYTDEQAINRYYIDKSGRMPDLNHPKKFSEKLQWLKLHDRNPLKAQCSDKYLVREYVAKCGYEHLLNTLYEVYEHVNEINVDELPDKFVLKATHGSGWNLIVKDKRSINWFLWRLIMRSWLKQNIYWSGREWVYKDLKPRIVAEKYLEDETGELRDYKFFCFNGEPRFMQLEVGRYAGTNTRNFYDMDWKLMPFGKEIPHNPDIDVPRPNAFDEMKFIAKELSKPFSYVRVDLYQVNGKVFFGELTFFPAGGAPDFIPACYDEIFGGFNHL